MNRKVRKASARASQFNRLSNIQKAVNNTGTSKNSRRGGIRF